MGSSRGQHTRPDDEAKINDISSYSRGVTEAIADWWLMGEADLAILGLWSFDQQTFARSASTRGARTRSLYLVNREGSTGGSTGEHRSLAMMPNSGGGLAKQRNI